MKLIFDTNICIDIIRRKDKKILDRFYNYVPSDIGISSITLSELEFGVLKSAKPIQNKLALTQFISLLEILPYDDKAAAEYGRIRNLLEKKGKPIGSLDTFIAAHALSVGCPLITNNVKEFKRVPGLKVINGFEF